MRKYLRGIARANMEAAGIDGRAQKRKIWVDGKKNENKPAKQKSFFADNWRKYATKKATKEAQAARLKRRCA